MLQSSIIWIYKKDLRSLFQFGFSRAAQLHIVPLVVGCKIGYDLPLQRSTQGAEMGGDARFSALTFKKG